MKIHPFAVIVGVLVLVGAVSLAAWGVVEKARNVGPSFNLSVEIPKETYMTGEPFFAAAYKFKYFGSSFYGTVVYREKKEGEPVEFLWASSGLIERGNLSGKLKSFNRSLAPFSILPENGYIGGKSRFTESGKYSYEIAVYRCSDLGFGEDCSVAPQEYEMKNFEGFVPLASTSKTITVDFSLDYAMAELLFSKTNTATEKNSAEVGENKTILDCNEEKECVAGYVKIFADDLKICRKSTGEVGVESEMRFGLYRGYEIVGSGKDGCEVKYWLINGPSELFSGKAMVCKYADLNADPISLSEMKNCSGELYDLLAPYFKNTNL